MTLIIKITISAARQALLVAPVVLAVLSACTPPKGVPDGGTGDGGVAVTRAEVIAAGSACVLATSKEFKATAVALETALGAPVSAQAFTTARAAFHTAMDQWQIAEVMLVGPAATSTSLGGGDLRDQLYSWPLVNRCAIEEVLVAKSYETNLGAQLINRRGLYAIEYLLFYEGTATACPASSPIVSSGSWAALSTTEREARRWAYAAKAASDVRVRAEEIVQRWDTEFLTTIQSAGPSNAVFKTQQQALNAISDALFYVEHDVKDVKLSRPIGLRDCAVAPCLDLLESQYGARSKANVKANLEGFRRIFTGCGPAHEGTAFDDLLLASGGEGLASRMATGMNGADAALAAIEEPDLAAALTTDPASVRALYDAIKGMSDILKTEIMGVLDLEVPKGLEGDND